MEYPKMYAVLRDDTWMIRSDANVVNGELFARVPHWRDDAEHLARLFAASGLMLEALEAIAEPFSDVSATRPDCLMVLGASELRMIRAAIAAAKGGE